MSLFYRWRLQHNTNGITFLKLNSKYIKPKTTFAADPACGFSKVDIDLECALNDCNEEVSINVGSLFNFSVTDINQIDDEVVKFFKNCRSKPWPPYTVDHLLYQKWMPLQH